MSDARAELSVSVSVGLADDERAAAAAIYYDAFAPLLRPILGEPALGLSLLAAAFDRERALVARRGDRVVGLCGLHFDDRHLVDLRVGALLRAHGPLRGLGRVLVGLLLARSPAADELLLDGVAVASDARGLGVGRRLLAEVERFAAARGLAAIRLDVVDTNPGARRLYLSCGYVEGATRASSLRRRFFGFAAATTMRKAVAPAISTSAAE